MTSENSGLTDSQMREPLFDYLEEFYGKIRIFGSMEPCWDLRSRATGIPIPG